MDDSSYMYALIGLRVAIGRKVLIKAFSDQGTLQQRSEGGGKNNPVDMDNSL